MTLEQKIGQSFFPAVFINDTEENIQKTETLIKKYAIGGLTFFHSRASAATNYENGQKVIWNDNSYSRLKELIIRYQKCASTPLLICIDAEWGLAMRIEKTPQYPYAITLGALPKSKINLVYDVGKQIGLDLKSAGIHYNLAPLADINSNPKNPVIGYRSFGEDKEKVALLSEAYLHGLSDAGILGCLKHFPGHGNTTVDSHLSLPILKENLTELMANELYPFIKGIENNVDSIMIGHLAIPALNEGKDISATLSKKIIQDLLRKQLGFKGVVISDALNMKSVADLYSKKGQLEWEAFYAGNDILCFSENVAEGIAEIAKNATPEQIESSYNRILQLKTKAGVFDKNTESTTLDFKKSTEINLNIAKNTLTKLKGEKLSELVSIAFNNKKLAYLSIGHKVSNPFFDTLETKFPAPKFSIEDSSYEKINWLEFDIIIVALFVPKAKPQNNFDIPKDVLSSLEKLLRTKKAILYIFGNPYSVKILENTDDAIGLIQVYQDFIPFQENAAQQLIDNSEYIGISPILI